jgi:hypothetical protein
LASGVEFIGGMASFVLEGAIVGDPKLKRLKDLFPQNSHSLRMNLVLGIDDQESVKLSRTDRRQVMIHT